MTKQIHKKVRLKQVLARLILSQGRCHTHMSFLTQSEREFLLGKREFTKDQQYYIRSRLRKKVKTFFGIELPLLDERGFLAACSKDLAAGCKVSDSPRPQVYGTERSLLLHENNVRKERPSSSAWQSEGFVNLRSIIRKEGADTLGPGFKSLLGLLFSLFFVFPKLNLALPG